MLTTREGVSSNETDQRAFRCLASSLNLLQISIQVMFLKMEREDNMTWQAWNIGTTQEDAEALSDMIIEMMREVVWDLDDPGFDEWFEAGIEIGEDVEIIVYREMQETDMTDIDGTMRPGYTLTIQWPDGQQETQTFFEDDGDVLWREYADYFSNIIVRYVEDNF